MRKKTKYSHKSVGYAYSTSPDAIKFGFAKMGCFVVELVPANGKPNEAIAGFITLDEAKRYADGLPYTYDKYSK